MTQDTKTAYVLVEIGWEYNDEYYHRPEANGGEPKGVFSTLEKAKDGLLEATYKYLTPEKGKWGYDNMSLWELFGEEGIEGELTKRGQELIRELFPQHIDVFDNGESYELFGFPSAPELTMAPKEKVLDFIRHGFKTGPDFIYEIYEVSHFD